ncbi:MAG: menaquinone-dependent protoporphyrinogen IX dehydrogenase [Gammaproteobacteria bacterium]|nr:menaquinone-dependent protoporphyrinogen IX dehydrogenase [Gammaproteobacteria bacterium]
MANILIIYSTNDGHTLEVCKKIQQHLAADNQVALQPVEQPASSTLDDYDKIIIGAAIRYGTHAQEVFQFIKTHHQVLNAKTNAFFSVSAVARKPNRNTPQTNPYLQRFLKQIDWKPQHLATFAGKVNYPIYNFWERSIIQLIMWITKGPTDTSKAYEFTDWEQVADFAQEIDQSGISKEKQ